MKYIRLEEESLYDGSQIKPMWAFKQFQIKDSSLISWIGPMDIKTDNLIDYEDVGLEIKGDKLLHFVIEHFDSQPADIRLCYHRQRLFVMIIKDLLNEMGIKTQRKGDDIYFKDEQDEKQKKFSKLSVSIATCSISSMKIHFALNLISKGTPNDVDVAGVLECSSFNKEDFLNFADKVCRNYINEILSIERDITKTKVLI
jgi:hypothetical protein